MAGDAAMTDELHPNYRRPDALPVELRDADVSDDARRWISAALRRPIVRAVRLPGASSTTVHRVEFEGRDPVVVKRYLWPGFLTDEPIAPRREVAALRYARPRWTRRARGARHRPRRRRGR